ncbi:uncharacterized protein LTR77_001138 [Saxophila tyrrhenica]|uniref:Uncharacterized protein n=1 Tax=Saxophila tyrrhenica TaxID=1690608 RepID=A0AAV9PJN6_9PEZI|nr:hypothetical protein LTR77_001138 [Saxophila tyrrhenica]
MSINWVMLAPASTPPYTPLPSEQTLFTSSPRIALNLSTPAHFPGKQQQPFNLSVPSGLLYLTNRRVIFLPDKSTPQIQSFAAPILNLHDSHVAAPWFGPNVWTALLQPTSGGGIPIPPGGAVEIKFTFKEGGAFDFHTHYERVRERLQQAMEVQRIDGDGAGAAQNRVVVENVNLEDLPVYQEQGDGPLIPPTVQDGGREGGGVGERSRENVPDEAPPGYEEAQMATLTEEVERRAQEGQR